MEASWASDRVPSSLVTKKGAAPPRAMEPEASQPPPRGRPPQGYVWSGDRYVHPESRAPFSRAEHLAALEEMWRQRRLLRYSTDENGVRTRHRETLAKSRRQRGAKARRKKLTNTLLAPVRSPAAKLKEDTDKSPPT